MEKNTRNDTPAAGTMAAINKELQSIVSRLNRVVGRLEQSSRRQNGSLFSDSQTAENQAQPMVALLLFISQIYSYSDEKMVKLVTLDFFTKTLRFPWIALFVYQPDGLKAEDVLVHGYPRKSRELKQRLTARPIQKDSAVFKIYEQKYARYISESGYDQELADMALGPAVVVVPLVEYGLMILGQPESATEISAEEMEILNLLGYIIGWRLLDLRKRVINESERHRLAEQLTLLNRFFSQLHQSYFALSDWINHELWTPIRNVQALLNSIDRKYSDQLSPDVGERFRRIKKIIHQSIGLFNEKREAAQLLKQEFKDAPVNLKSILLTIQTELQPILDQNRIQLRLADEFPEMAVNQKLLKYVLRDILLLLIHRFPSREGEKWIKVTSATEQNMVIVKFEDNSLQGVRAAGFESDINEAVEFAFGKNMVEFYEGQFVAEEVRNVGLRILISLKT